MSNILNNSPLTNNEREQGSADWAESLTEISAALRKLQDSIPNCDKAKTVLAYEALAQATHLLGDYLVLRGAFNTVSQQEKAECQSTNPADSQPSSTEST